MSHPTVTVLVAAEGRHLFDGIHDARVRVTTDCAVDPRLVVLPVSRFRRFENLAQLSLPEPVCRSIADGRTGLVFDASLEGVRHKPDITAALHEAIHRLGGAPQQAMYVTQDRRYEAEYRSYCAAHGLEPVTVLTHDYWIWAALAEYEATGEQAYQARLAAFRERHPTRSRRFVSLNRTPRPTKILFLLSLLRDGLWDHGYISFGGFRQKAGSPGKDRPTASSLRQALPGFDDLIGQLAPHLDRLDSYGRVLLGLERQGWHRLELGDSGRAVALEECDDTWFSVVPDTEMRPRPSRITEKALKPLVNFHPLLVLGNPDALKMIRSYGFVTFGEIVDERYDDEWDPRRRFDLVYAEVRRLCAATDGEWQRFEQQVSEKLAFNARWGLTRFPSVYRQQYDRALVSDLLIATRTAHF